MIELRLEHGDLLEAKADAVVVPVDGTFVPQLGKFDRILGNIGRQLARRFPDADVIEELDSQLSLPLALGRAAPVDLAVGPFRHLIVVSTLHHSDLLEMEAKRGLVRTSFSSCLDVAKSAGIESLASAVLQGGWRLSKEEAFSSMLAAIADRRVGPTVVMRCIDPEVHGKLSALARSFGF